MAIEIVDLPMKHGGSFHSYVSLPEGFAAAFQPYEMTIIKPAMGIKCSPVAT